jgi:hypothetical protein
MPDSKPANDVASYAADVRAALGHLPDAERDSLLEDLESHLAEVASESDLSLEERLGKPADYAAELKSAYGAGSAAVEAKQRRLFRDRLWAMLRLVSGTQVYRELRALVPELRPGWWVLRAYLVVLVLAFMFRDGTNLRPIPNPFSRSGLLQILATFVAIVISVRLGRRGMPVNRVGRGAVQAVNAAIALFALPVLVSMGTGYMYAYTPTDSSNPYFSDASAGYYPGFTNIYPYSKDGKPLKDVLLYDQDGRPVVPVPDGVVSDVPVGSDGLPIPNAYPLTQRDLKGDPIVTPRVALPPWQAASTASPTPTTSPTPARSP